MKTTKTKASKILGVSRPTLDKMLHNSKLNVDTLIKSRLVLSAISNIPEAPPTRIDDFMEWLDDNDMLSEEGKELRSLIWKEFIQE